MIKEIVETKRISRKVPWLSENWPTNLVCEFLDFRRIQVSSSEDLASTQTKLKDSDVPTTRSPAMSAASFSMRLWQHYDRKAKSIAGSRLLQLPWHKRYL
jgi:hypothetical protein